MGKIFHTATDQEIKSGQITDVYFQRTLEILKADEMEQVAAAEIRLRKFDQGWTWGILAGVEEAMRLLEDLPVDVEALPEGTVFHEEEPVLTITGRYRDYAVYETALLGLLCQASGVATNAARCRKAAGERPVISFGARRMHPAIAPMIERNAFIGGCKGVAVSKSAELIGQVAVGTMPHSLILIYGDLGRALEAFHRVIDRKVHRVALVDTFNDEKFASLKAARTLGKNLYGVRLDTPGSRRGNMLEILREVRWELDLAEFQHVKIFVSGGLDEKSIAELSPYADAYGVGTSISNAPVVNFALDIVEIEGRPVAKRGKLSGTKQLWACRRCGMRRILPRTARRWKCPCGGTAKPLLRKIIKKGKVAAPLPSPAAIRKYVLSQLQGLELHP